MLTRPAAGHPAAVFHFDTPTLPPDVAAVLDDDVADLLSGPTAPEPPQGEGHQLALDYEVIGPGSEELGEWLNTQAWSAINFHAKPVLDSVDAGDFTPKTPAELWERVRPEDGDLAAMADSIATKALSSGLASPHGNIGRATLDQLCEVRRRMEASPSKRPTPARRRKHRTRKASANGSKSHAARRRRRTEPEARLLDNVAAGLSDAANLAALQAQFGDACPWTTRAGVGATRRRLQDAPEALITPAPDPVTTELSPPTNCHGITIRGRSCGRKVSPGAQGCRYHPNATSPPALPKVVAAPPPFPAPELPPAERWPINMFAKLTGIHLDGDEARWLASWGQAYEADGGEDDLADLIRISAGAAVDPWAYLQTAIANGTDAWTVPAQLLGQVLTSAGQQSLEYALTAIGGGYVPKPLPYLRTCEANGNHPTVRPERTVAMAVALARRWAPRLVITDVATAIDAEESTHRTRHMFSYRRRFGRLPWEPEPPALAPSVALSPNTAPVGDNATIPVNPVTIINSLVHCKLKSSRARVRDSGVVTEHGLTLAPGEPERPPPVPPPPEPVERHPRPLPNAGDIPDLEHGPCRHPLAPMLALAMDLAAAVKVDCAVAGCGCHVYSVQGPVHCPCHWPAARAAAVRRALEAHAAA